MKKPPQKVAYLSRNSVVSEIFLSSQTAQIADFMFQNVAYRATVYRTGSFINKFLVLSKFLLNFSFDPSLYDRKLAGFDRLLDNDDMMLVF